MVDSSKSLDCFSISHKDANMSNCNSMQVSQFQYRQLGIPSGVNAVITNGRVRFILS